MKAKLELSFETIEELEAFFAGRSTTAAPVDEDVVPPNAGDYIVSPEVEPEVVEPEVVEPEVVEPEVVEGKVLTPIEAAVADASSKYSLTAGCTLPGGAVVAAGDEVADIDTGEVYVVESTYRGRCVVSREDGSADLMEVKVLQLPGEGAQEPEDKPSEGDENALRELARMTIQTKGPAKVLALFSEHGAGGVGEIPLASYPAVTEALNAILAG